MNKKTSNINRTAALFTDSQTTSNVKELKSNRVENTLEQASRIYLLSAKLGNQKRLKGIGQKTENLSLVNLRSVRQRI